MRVLKVTSVDIDASQERVVAVAIRNDLESARQVVPNIVAVRTNGVPDGAVGQVVTMTMRVLGRNVETVQTTLESELPDQTVEYVETSTISYLATTRFIALDENLTRVELITTSDLPPRRVLDWIALQLTPTWTLRKGLERLKKSVETARTHPGTTSETDTTAVGADA